MTILILDASGPYAVLAVAAESGEVISSLTFEASRTLSTRLFAGIEEVLSLAGLGKQSIGGLAVGTGPGSFTGVRIALTTFRTLAQALEVPIVGLSSLDAYAEPLLALSYDRPIAAGLPSRRGEVYASVYANGKKTLGPIAESTDDFRKRIELLKGAHGAVIVCGRVESVGDLQDAAVIRTCWPAPDALARSAAILFRTGDVDSPLTLTPEYVVAPVITTPRDPDILPREISE